MPQEHELKQLHRSVIDAFEHTAPSKWRRLVTEVFERQRFDDLQRFYGHQVTLTPKKFYEDYLEWKALLGSRALKDGSAFGRQFWDSLLNTSKQMPIKELESYHMECCAMLMREMLATFTRADLCKAEELNDAGYERHHYGGYEQAIPLHDQAIGLEPEFSIAWINKGIVLKNLNRLDEAIACYDHVIKNIDSRYKKAWHNKGVALQLKEEFLPAIECLDQAISLDPGYEIAIRVRETCLVALHGQAPTSSIAGMIDKLKKKFDGKTHEFSIFHMASELKERGNYSASARLFDQLCSLMPNDSDLLFYAGDAWYEAGQKKDAMDRFNRALVLDPENGDVWINKARYYLEDNNPAEALKMANQAVKYASNHSMAWANRASALFALERYTEGVESGERAINLDNHNPYGLYYLGVCLWCLHRNKEAYNALERLIRVRPDCYHLVQSAHKILELLPRQSHTWGASRGRSDVKTTRNSAYLSRFILIIVLIPLCIAYGVRILLHWSYVKFFLFFASIIAILGAMVFITHYQRIGIYETFNRSPNLQTSPYAIRKMLYYSGVPFILFIIGGILMLLALFNDFP